MENNKLYFLVVEDKQYAFTIKGCVVSIYSVKGKVNDGELILIKSLIVDDVNLGSLLPKVKKHIEIFNFEFKTKEVN